jgi:LysR family transcriptional regulator for metE and metH
MDLEIRHLRLVTAIADTGSMTRASERLFVTPSALSHQLRDIEARLDTRLFRRVGRRMVPTAAGEDLVAAAARVLALVDDTESRLKARAVSGARTLRVSTQCYTCYHWLPKVLTAYRRTHPKATVQIDAGATANAMGALFDGRIDLAIMIDPVSDRRVTETILFDDELVVATAPDHRLTLKPFVDAADFARETLYVYPPKAETTVYARVLKPARVEPASIEQVQLTEAIVELVKGGHGIGVLARWAIQPHIDDGSIAAVRLTRRGFSRQWRAVALRETAAQAHVREFVALVARQAPAYSEPRKASTGGVAARRRA